MLDTLIGQIERDIGYSIKEVADSEAASKAASDSHRVLRLGIALGKHGALLDMKRLLLTAKFAAGGFEPAPKVIVEETRESILY